MTVTDQIKEAFGRCPGVPPGKYWRVPIYNRTAVPRVADSAIVASQPLATAEFWWEEVSFSEANIVKRGRVWFGRYDGTTIVVARPPWCPENWQPRR